MMILNIKIFIDAYLPPTRRFESHELSDVSISRNGTTSADINFREIFHTWPSDGRTDGRDEVRYPISISEYEDRKHGRDNCINILTHECYFTLGMSILFAVDALFIDS